MPGGASARSPSPTSSACAPRAPRSSSSTSARRRSGAAATSPARATSARASSSGTSSRPCPTTTPTWCSTAAAASARRSPPTRSRRWATRGPSRWTAAGGRGRRRGCRSSGSREPPRTSRGGGRVIRLRQLSKRFGKVEAVRGLDLEIPSGQLVGLLGPNGAGKSTTVKMLTGMLPPSAGTAEIFGLDVVREPVDVKKIVGYVPESGAVFETLTGWEYLHLVAALYRLPEDETSARIRRFAEFFELSDRTLRREQLGAYSKGMRQRVVITAALLHNPRAIFFDEPLNGLDANAALAFKTLITSLAREGKTIIYCSHLLDVVERVCERIVIIHEGRLIADGSLAQLQEETAEVSLERIFNRLTATEHLLARTEEFARVLPRRGPRSTSGSA